MRSNDGNLDKPNIGAEAKELRLRHAAAARQRSRRWETVTARYVYS